MIFCGSHKHEAQAKVKTPQEQHRKKVVRAIIVSNGMADK